MDESKKEAHLRYLIGYSFLLNVLLGGVSYFFPNTNMQLFLWTLCAFFMIISSSLLASKFTREGHDIPAAGFTVLAIAQAMSYGFLATHDSGDEQLGAVIVIFVPGLLLISFYVITPLVFRISSLIAAFLFAALAILLYIDMDKSALPYLRNFGYLFMNISVAGWAWLILKKKI